MIVAASPRIGPVGAALLAGYRLIMDIVLHLGAHRTATTTFQSYMRHNSDELSKWGVGFWGPNRTRGGMFAGILPGPGRVGGRDAARRARGRVALHLAQAERRDVNTLIVSEENMLGTVRDNLRRGALYPGVGQRMARYGEAFGGRITRIVLSVRALDLYWASAAAYGVARGTAMRDPAAWVNIAANRRSWRDVITDLACAVPDAELRVLPFEEFGTRPDLLLTCGADCYAPRDSRGERLNAAPDTARLRALLRERGDRDDGLPPGPGVRWNPFTPAEAATLREKYADDLHWLSAGADGLATLTEDTGRTKTVTEPQPRRKRKKHRGRPDAIQERPVA